MSQFLLATGSYDSTVRLLDAQNASILRTFSFPDVAVLSLAFSGMGPVHASNNPLFLVVGGSPRVAVFDASHSETAASPIFMFDGHSGPVVSVGWEPIARPTFAFSASEDHTLQIWDPRVSERPVQVVPDSQDTAGSSIESGVPSPAATQSLSEAKIKFDNKCAINATAYERFSQRFSQSTVKAT